MKKEGKRGFDYVKKRTGHTFWYFSHGFSHGMTLNSNTLIQAKANKLQLLGYFERLLQLRKQRCIVVLLTLD